MNISIQLLRRLLYPVLVPLSWVYAAGLRLYLLPYDIGIRKRHQLSCPVVCAGNLTFGGTGKTPAVITLAKEFGKRGLRVVVLSRGHGGRLSRTGAVVSSGGERLLSAGDCGDEPALIADSLPGVPVVIGKNRVTMGKFAIEEFSPDLILMDDGMQYWQIHKDCTVALMNAREPFGKGGVLPAGTLREPKTGLRRTSAIIATNSDRVTGQDLDLIRKQTRRINPDADIYTARHIPESLFRMDTHEIVSPEYLKGRHITALSSIGSPESFESTLLGLGAELTERIRYPDHHPFNNEDIQSIKDKSMCVEVVTTEKDAVRLKKEESGNLLVLSVRLEIDNIDGLVDSILTVIGR